MSFEFKGPSFKPMIQEAQSMLNNGGGGNLGYFKRGKKDKDKKDESAGDLFGGPEDDSFEHELRIEGEKSDFSKVKDFFSNFVEKFKKPIEKNEGQPKQNPFM